MSWGELVPSVQRRRLPRRRLIQPWVWDVATVICAVGLLVGFVVMVVLAPDAFQALRGWHIAIVAPR